jgi:hypothetical protein
MESVLYVHLILLNGIDKALLLFPDGQLKAKISQRMKPEGLPQNFEERRIRLNCRAAARIREQLSHSDFRRKANISGSVM